MSDWMRKILYYENILAVKQRTGSQLLLEEVQHLKLCRTCLNDVKDSHSADLGDDHLNVMGLDGQLIRAKDMLNVTTGIEIIADERMPVRICRECLSKISIFYLFKLQSKRSENVLRRMLSKLDESHEELEIIEECTSPIGVATKEDYLNTTNFEMETLQNSEESEDNTDMTNEEKLEEEEEIGLDSKCQEIQVETQRQEISYSDIEGDYDYADDGPVDAAQEEGLAEDPKTNSGVGDAQSDHSLNKNSLVDSLSCAVCNKAFALQRLLTSHIHKFHPNEKAFKCRICQKTFTHLQSLSRHMQIHLAKTTKKVCSICSKHFLRADDWRRHLRTHTDERPYVCHICGKRFKQTGELKEHVLTHSKQRRFECSICGHCLLSRNGLYVHKKSHECPLCNKCFLTKAEVKLHQKVHNALRTNKHGSE